MGNMKVDHDLQLEKMKKEKDHDGSAHVAEVDKKDTLITKLKEEIDKLTVDLEMVKDELTAKTEEAEDLQADLEIKEAGFNNRYEPDFSHQFLGKKSKSSIKDYGKILQCTLLQGGCKSKNQCLQIRIKYTFLYSK